MLTIREIRSLLGDRLLARQAGHFDRRDAARFDQ